MLIPILTGGYNGTSRLFTGEKYNPVTRTWSSIPDMYTPRSNYAIAVIDDMIFVMGGYNGTTTVCHVECYCAKNNEWYFEQFYYNFLQLQNSRFYKLTLESLPHFSIIYKLVLTKLQQIFITIYFLKQLHSFCTYQISIFHVNFNYLN